MTTYSSRWKKNIGWFIAGQTFSIFGSALVQYAIIWHITLLTESGVMLTISAICGFLPQLAISLFSGVWADRYSRKKLVIFGDTLTAAATLILAILFLMGYQEIWLLFIVSAVRAVGGGIQSPAVNAIVPQLVPQEQLTRVNGINNSLQSLNMIVAPVASGALLTLAPLQTIFFIDVITAAIGIGIVACLHIPPLPSGPDAEQTGYWDDLKSGLRYTVSHHIIGYLLIFYGLFMFCVTPVALLTPLQVARRFGGEVWHLTVMEIVFSAGSVLGGIIVAVWGGFKNRIHSIALSYIAFGVSTFALGLPMTIVPYMTIMGLAGITVPLFSSAFMVLLQETVEPTMHGRVFGLVQILATAALPLGMVAFGPISDFISIEMLLVITGILIVVQGTFLMFGRRSQTQN